MTLTIEELKKIGHALDWYEGTDGSEREQASDAMYQLLIGIYNSAVQEYLTTKK